MQIDSTWVQIGFGILGLYFATTGSLIVFSDKYYWHLNRTWNPKGDYDPYIFGRRDQYQINRYAIGASTFAVGVFMLLMTLNLIPMDKMSDLRLAALFVGIIALTFGIREIYANRYKRSISIAAIVAGLTCLVIFTLGVV